MTDHLSPEDRSRNMARIRSMNTEPELALRRLLHRMGYRYLIHHRQLPGTPDIVFPRRQKAIFVHGCFWHQHSCRRGTRPLSNQHFWGAKLDRNIARDQRIEFALQQLGWSVLVVWECQVGDTDHLAKRLTTFLGAPRFVSTPSP